MGIIRVVVFAIVILAIIVLSVYRLPEEDRKHTEDSDRYAGELCKENYEVNKCHFYQIVSAKITKREYNSK